MPVKVTGGKKIAQIAKSVKSKNNLVVKAGFFEDRAYGEAKNGLSVAQVATWNEYGFTGKDAIQIQAREQTVYRKIDKEGNFLKDGKFVKKSQSNFATTHHVDEYEINIPPRPFMQQAFDNNKNKWQNFINQAIVKQSGNYDINKIAVAVGEMMRTAIRGSIRNGDFAPNAPSTIAKKGNEPPLVDSTLMLNSVNYQVVKK